VYENPEGGMAPLPPAANAHELRYSFICQGTSVRRQRSDLFDIRVKLPPVQSNHSKVEAIPFSALPRDTTSELSGLYPH